jgi:hypothetical protein
VARFQLALGPRQVGEHEQALAAVREIARGEPALRARHALARRESERRGAVDEAMALGTRSSCDTGAASRAPRPRARADEGAGGQTLAEAKGTRQRLLEHGGERGRLQEAVRPAIEARCVRPCSICWTIGDAARRNAGAGAS